MLSAYFVGREASRPELGPHQDTHGSQQLQARRYPSRKHVQVTSAYVEAILAHGGMQTRGTGDTQNLSTRPR